MSNNGFMFPFGKIIPISEYPSDHSFTVQVGDFVTVAVADFEDYKKCLVLEKIEDWERANNYYAYEFYQKIKEENFEVIAIDKFCLFLLLPEIHIHSLFRKIDEYFCNNFSLDKKFLNRDVISVAHGCYKKIKKKKFGNYCIKCKYKNDHWPSSDKSYICFNCKL